MSDQYDDMVRLYAILAALVLKAGGEISLDKADFDGVRFEIEVNDFQDQDKVIIRASKGGPIDFSIPRIYIPPYGHPYYWVDEQSGTLAEAVRAFLGNTIGERDITDEQGKAVIDYIQYYMDAPSWNQFEHIVDLRQQAARIESLQDARAFIALALANGIDPL